MITLRKYDTSDFERAINFFRDMFWEDNKPGYWLPQRFEYAENLVSPLHRNRGILVDWKETIFLWETEMGEIVAILSSEYPDENISVHTKRNYRHLEEEMIKIAEDKIICQTLGKSNIKVWCQRGDGVRELLLKKNGYEMQTETEYLNWINLEQELPEIGMPKEFVLHDMTDEQGLDLQFKITQMTGAFDSKPYPVEIYRQMQSSPSYRKDLDLYTVDKMGNIASFCIIWLDKKLMVAYFEPVGTHASHRGQGLGKATLNAGLQRLKKMGVKQAYVGAANEGLMKFYNSSGFADGVKYYSPWGKTIV